MKAIPMLAAQKQSPRSFRVRHAGERLFILSGLLADKGRAVQISTAMRRPGRDHRERCVAVVTLQFNHAIDAVIQNNPKARGNPKALVQLDGYKRPLLISLVGAIFSGLGWKKLPNS